MKYRVVLAVAFSLMCATWSARVAAQDTGKFKLGILELGAFRTEVGELKQKYEKLQIEFAPKQRELESMQSSIEAKQKALQETKSLTAQQAAKLQDEVQELQRELQRKTEDAQAMAQKREREETGAIYDKISKFLEQYCAQKGITQVLEAGQLRESGMVVYANPKAFITDDFVKEYNKANPSAAK